MVRQIMDGRKASGGKILITPRLVYVSEATFNEELCGSGDDILIWHNVNGGEYDLTSKAC